MTRKLQNALKTKNAFMDNMILAVYYVINESMIRHFSQSQKYECLMHWCISMALYMDICMYGYIRMRVCLYTHIGAVV